MKLALSVRAQNDLSDIWAYTELHWGKKQMEKYAALLWETLGSIERNPQIGKRRIGMPKNVKSYKAGKHVIFYRLEDRSIIVDCVLHERMDFRGI